MSYWTTNLSGRLRPISSRETIRIGQEGQIGGPDGRFAYFETEAHPGTVIEVSDISGSKGAFFEKIKRAAADWDGSRPIRTIT